MKGGGRGGRHTHQEEEVAHRGPPHGEVLVGEDVLTQRLLLRRLRHNAVLDDAAEELACAQTCKTLLHPAHHPFIC